MLIIPVVSDAHSDVSCLSASVLMSGLFSVLSSRFKVLSRSFRALLNCSSLSMPVSIPVSARLAKVCRRFLNRAICAWLNSSMSRACNPYSSANLFGLSDNPPRPDIKEDRLFASDEWRKVGLASRGRLNVTCCGGRGGGGGAGGGPMPVCCIAVW